MTTRLAQTLIVAVGVCLAMAGVILGLWQMQAFVDSGNRGVAERAAQAPVPLASHLDARDIVGDVYGKQVIAEGRYLAEQQFIVLGGDGVARVLTAFELADGRVLPVVRGLAEDDGTTPAPPAGELTQVGLLLPGEGDAADAAPGELTSVRMPRLAQLWPQQLVPGFITLTDTEAAAQGLAAAPVHLPGGEGSARNGGYALQWWVFGGFALAASIRIAHVTGRRAAAAAEAEAAAALTPGGTR